MPGASAALQHGCPHLSLRHVHGQMALPVVRFRHLLPLEEAHEQMSESNAPLVRRLGRGRIRRVQPLRMFRSSRYRRRSRLGPHDADCRNRTGGRKCEIVQHRGCGRHEMLRILRALGRRFLRRAPLCCCGGCDPDGFDRGNGLCRHGPCRLHCGDRGVTRCRVSCPRHGRQSGSLSAAGHRSGRGGGKLGTDGRRRRSRKWRPGARRHRIEPGNNACRGGDTEGCDIARQPRLDRSLC